MKLLKILGAGLLLLALALAGVLLWARGAANAKLDTRWELPEEALPSPWPLGPEGVRTLQAERATDRTMAVPVEPELDPTAGAEAWAIPPMTEAELGDAARRLAIARGGHLATALLDCAGCHGEDLGGAVRMDVPPVAGIIGPNLTRGAGGLGPDFDIADFERALRHGVKRDGRTSMMDVGDFADLTNREVSDLWAWLGSLPPVDRVMKPSYLGPVFWVLWATGRQTASAFEQDHGRQHGVEPPPLTPDASYGAHLAQFCAGCHGADFSGGPIPGGDPSWPPAANLTPHGDGLAGWTRDQFFAAMTEGRRPDGRVLDAVMPWTSYRNLEPMELDALWVWLQSLPPWPTPE